MSCVKRHVHQWNVGELRDMNIIGELWVSCVERHVLPAPCYMMNIFKSFAPNQWLMSVRIPTVYDFLHLASAYFKNLVSVVSTFTVKAVILCFFDRGYLPN